MDNQAVEILLVEDKPADEELTLHTFRRHKLANRVHVVRDGAEALDFVFARGQYEGRETTNSPRVILLDLKLPKIDGLEVLRAIKSDPRTCTIPVVVLTSSQEEQDLVRSYQLGVNSYIIKPVNFEQFDEAIREVGFYWLLLNKIPAR